MDLLQILTYGDNKPLYSLDTLIIEGMELIDLIKKGEGPNGQVTDPDKMISLSIK